MKRCQGKGLKPAQRIPKRLTMCLRRVVPGTKKCAKHSPKPLPEAEMIYQTLNPLADYVEAEVERSRRMKEDFARHDR